MICKCGIQYFNTQNHTSLQCKECGYELVNKEKRVMNYKRGKQFESAVEMAQYLSKNDYVIGACGVPQEAKELAGNDIIDFYDNYFRAIEEKEDEVREFFRYDYITAYTVYESDHLDKDFKAIDGTLDEGLRDIPNSQKRKIESSKIRVRMSDLTIVENE